MKPHPVQPSATLLDNPHSSCKCKLCGEPILLTMVGIPIVGETEAQRLGRIYQVLGKHLQSKHGHDPRFAVLMASPGELATLAMLSAYETQDVDLLRAQDQIRWKIHQITRRSFISDETIREKVEGLDLPPDKDNLISSDERVEQMCRAMRDVMMEKDAYPELLKSKPE